jgi:N-acetylmuramoyl-L-alanine amidase
MIYPFLLTLAIDLAHAAPLSVLIDAGHGGKDRGAVRGEIVESEITLNVSRLLYGFLDDDRRFRALLSRDRDRFLSLEDRAQLAGARKADVFVSIHVNSNPDPKARGAEFYFQNQLPPDEESLRMAHLLNSGDNETASGPYEFVERAGYPAEVSSILTDLLDGHRILRSSQLSTALKAAWKGSRKTASNSVRQAPFFVLSELRIPSALVELGFLTNADDLKQLQEPAHQRRMAMDLYRGLVRYKESLDKLPTSP